MNLGNGNWIIKQIFLFVLLLIIPALNVLAVPANLMSRAKITASGKYSQDYDPKYLVDGKIPRQNCHNDVRQAWCLPRTQANGATLTIEWPNPVKIAEVVYWGRTAFEDGENFSACEVYADDPAKPIARAKLERGPQPQRISLDKPLTAKKITLRFPAHYGGSNPGASEIAVYETRPAEADIPLPDGMYHARLSPETIAEIRAGKMGFTRLLLVQRQLLNPTHVYTYHQEDLRPGGGLWIYDFSGTEPKFDKILDSTDGVILDANLHYDGRTILFSWKRTMQDHFQLYTIDIDEALRTKVHSAESGVASTLREVEAKTDGKNLRQLTDHISNNFNASWLPDGGIVFLSDRKPAFAYCWKTTTPILYRCQADGSKPIRISANYLNDFTPAVMQDGRIIYSRWEYVDRPAIPIQSLWTINPDGTHLTGFFGNRVLSPATFMDAREIPDSKGKVLCVLTSHNGPCRGAIGIIDPKFGSNAQEAITNLTPEIDIGLVDKGNGNHIRGPYLNPFPLDDKYYLVSKAGIIELRDYQGSLNATIVLPTGLGFYNPQPIRTRPQERLVTSTLPKNNGNSHPWATIFMQNVYAGLDPKLVPPGTVKQLAIVQEIEKPIGIDPGLRAFGFQFPVVSAGATYAPKKIWGYATVEADGSAYFKVPAQEPIYFLPLDAEGRAVQRMRTFTHLMPGEFQGCIGCHADRNSAALKTESLRSIAMKRVAEELTLPPWGLRGFSYSRIVQPVWDKHCIRCHGRDNPSAGLELTGDKTDFFNISYENLVRKGTPSEDFTIGGAGGTFNYSKYTSWIPTYNGQEANILEITPGHWGAKASLLAKIINGEHREKDGKNRFELSNLEKKAVYTWMDLNCPYYSSSDSTYRENRGCRQILPNELNAAFKETSERRCISCHKQKNNSSIFSYPKSFAVRIDNPERNLFLKAPLSKSAGGTEACGKAVFADTSDPDYQKLLRSFEPLKAELEKNPRLDMSEISSPDIAKLNR
ncbi:MAG: hypothetical protein PHR77_03560 [Kiritimatiellae bacterium]|nr:hypothetical protein [Kiritimatiellia bacterium]MDD5522048.1 hypothetical protein [Kiritimatiellia bacterium]